MYLNPQIHDTQDTFMIHVGYTGIHSRIRISSPTCGRAWKLDARGDEFTSCISDVSRMYLHYPCRYMYPACIPHVFCISDTYTFLSPGCRAVELSRLRRGAVEALSRRCRGAVEALSRPCLSSLSSSCRVPVEPVEFLSSSCRACRA